MASVHQINNALASVRGMQLATVESYTRTLRREGVLPETRRGGAATPATTDDAAMILLALMRGSPGGAAANALAAGHLVIESDPIIRDIERRVRAALGWCDTISFAQAVSWLIERFAKGETSSYIAAGDYVKVSLDRYWHHAWIEFHPSADLLREFIIGWREYSAMIGETAADHEARMAVLIRSESLVQPLRFDFKSPLIAEARATFDSDPSAHRDAWRRFKQEKADSLINDVWGYEWITNRTLLALGRVFSEARADAE